MKKFLKIILWIAFVAVIITAILGGIGYKMQTGAEKFLTDQGFKNVFVMQASDVVLCKGGATGMAVYADLPYESEEEGKMYPICVTLTGKAELGTFAK